MKSKNSIIEEIHQRITHLKTLENEYKQKNNTSGRLNVKTRREELQRLLTTICNESNTTTRMDAKTNICNHENERKAGH